MHNNYYFLEQLSGALNGKLIGYELTECFSQNKNELIFGFNNKGLEFYIKAYLDPAFCCLSFPRNFSRARKNSVDLFDELLLKKVSGVYQFVNERCFVLRFGESHQLLFKMHGNRSNIILYRNNEITEIFKKHLKKDLNLDINDLDRPIDQSFQSFVNHGGDHKAIFPTFGKVIEKHLQLNGLNEKKDLKEKWSLIQQTLQKLTHPEYYITILDNRLHLSLLEVGSVKHKFSEPIEALNTFYVEYITDTSLKNLKHEKIASINRQLKQSLNYIKKTTAKLDEVEHRLDYSKLADILMANLHQISSKAEEVTLENFYQDSVPVTIKLKRNLSPQKNAEGYYRKAKNQSLEIRNLKDNLSRKIAFMKELEEQKLKIENETDLRVLRKKSKADTASKDKRRPFISFEFNGYQIWVGKNARSNDEMLQQYSFKDDLWLHAREVTGSHVLLKYQAGKNFPGNVIEKAAEFAAYYSKRKTDSLCPVIVTPRKFVRKRKGDPAGAVIVDKEEEILLVRPGNQV